MQLNLKITSIAENAIQIQVDKEDYSIADIVHKELLNVKHVKFAGVPPPHPLIKTLTIQLHTDGVAPNKVLSEALDLAQHNLKQLLDLARTNFPRSQPAQPANESTNSETQMAESVKEVSPETTEPDTAEASGVNIPGNV